MSRVYTTRQGETVDFACWKTYGRTADVTEAVLGANPGLADLGPVLPIGTKITMPDISKEESAPQLVTLW